jgi:DoxX-like family
VPTFPVFLEAFSIAAFLFYGSACLLSPKLIAEFERYRLARWRRLVGWLEVAGALGLLAGQLFPPLKVAAASGLFLLMMCGLWARWRVRDPWYALLPALILGLVNFTIAYFALSGR